MQEILVVAAIAAAVFFLPRWLGRKSPEPVFAPRRRAPLFGWMRLAILITALWLAGTALYLKPWEEAPLLYLCVGPAPALLFWGGVWVWHGFKKYRR